MLFLGFRGYVTSCYIAYGASSRRTSGRLVAFGSAGLYVTVYGGVLLFVSAVNGWSSPFVGHGIVQLGLVGMYVLAYGLVPAGLLRLVPRFRRPRVAFFLAAAVPFLGLGAYALWGNDRGWVSGGIGNLEDLLFLNPFEMYEGVTREGVITHRFRVHYGAVVALVVCALALQLVPVREDDGEPPSAASPG